jgi:hypothetical protein
MKCNNCKTAIPPTFTKALQDNACPACGEPIMSKSLFAEFAAIKEKLVDAEIDEATIIKVAAVIAGKYDLVQRGVSPMQAKMPNTKKTRLQLDDDQVEQELMAEYPHLQTLGEEERKLEIAALRAEAQREFALSTAGATKTISTRPLKTSEVSESPFADLISDMMPPDISGLQDGDTSSRAARAAALRNNPDVSKLRRIQD